MNNKTPKTVPSTPYNFIILILLLLTQYTLPYHISGDSIYDLEETDSTAFATEVESWTASALKTSGVKTSSCWDYPIVGGYNILSAPTGYFYRQYTGLSSHNVIYVSIKIFQIDSWDYTDGDHFNIGFDSTIIVCWSLQRLSAWVAQSCGNSYTENKPMMTYATVPHTSDSLTLYVYSKFDQASSDESLGFRDITITTATLDDPPTSATFCGITQGFPLDTDWCTCDDGQYMYPSQSGICIDCDDNCATCSGSSTTCTSCDDGMYLSGTTCYECDDNCATCKTTSTTCTTCNSGWYMVGTTCYDSCDSPLYSYVSGVVTYCATPCPGQYVMWDGSCSDTCAYSTDYSSFAITAETVNTFAECTYPCSDGQYLYWNGSCLDSCSSPLTTLTYYSAGFCDYSCSSTQYLYWNGSCLDSCPSPLSGELQGTYLQRYFCWYTCQPSEYLYWNGSCLSTCPFPLAGETQGTNLARSFCWYICMPWQWVYWDQTCQESCESPLWPETQGTYLERQFCWYPCTSESKFLYWNGTCLSECPEPLSTRYQNGQWFCDYPCSDITEYLYWNGSCLSTCESPLSARSEGSPARNFCYYLCETDEFLYWDGSCQSSCDSPLTAVSEGDPSRQFCWYLCDTDEYLYWNGTCSTECEFPLTKTVENGRNYCEYPCLPYQYLYWNGSCLATCPYSLSTRIEGDLIKTNFCDFPCETTEYLYWNGSCLDTCYSPLSTRIEGSTSSRKFCDYPCVGKQFLYWNGSCKTRCQLPLVTRIEANRGYCDYICVASDLIYWDGSCGSSCDSPLVLKSYGTPTRNYCTFPCQAGQFLYQDGNCSDSCPSPLVSSAYKSQLFCNYSCSADQFLYWNGSCLDTCPLPFSIRIQDSSQFCDYPCSESDYLYWNGSCIASCDFPFSARTTDDKLYCDSPCESTSEYLYWNGTCSSTCSSPFTLISNLCTSACKIGQYLYGNGTCSTVCNSPLFARIDNNVLLCESPCSSTDYLFWNSSCSSTCPIPLIAITVSGNNYCNRPCRYDSEYAYWNGTCSPLCNFPLQTRNESNMLYCDYPCDPSEYLFFTGVCIEECDLPYTAKVEGVTVLRNFCGHNCTYDEYLYWNGSCREKCKSPRRIISNNSIQYCEKPCEEPNIYYYETLKECEATCDSPGYSYTNIDYLVCVSSSDNSVSLSNFEMFLHAPLQENALTFVSLVKTMQYVRYMDINMPSRLQRLAESKSRPLLSVKSGIKMWDGLKEHFTQEQTLADVYANLNLSSSFLVNYWEDLMTIFIGLILAIIFSSCEKLSRAFEKEKAEVIFRTLQVLTKWNFIIIIIAFNIDDVILYSALQLRNWDTSSFANTISSLSAIIAILFIIGFFIGISYLILSQNYPNNTESYQVIFKSFNSSALFTKLFFVFYTLRIAVPLIITICTENIPLLNILLQLFFSLGVLTFILWKKPLNKRINHIQLVVFETIIFFMNLSMFLITTLSIFEMQNHIFTIILGDFVILGNDFINILALNFMVIKFHLEIKQIRQQIKNKAVQGSKRIGLWVQLLFIPLQQASMGFEEIIAYPTNIPRLQARARRIYEESEISLKKNLSEVTFIQGIISETNMNNFEETENYLEKSQDATTASNPKRDLSRYLDTTPSNPELLNISPKALDNFQIDVLTFDKKYLIDFSIFNQDSKHNKSIFKGIKYEGNEEFFISESVEPTHGFSDTDIPSKEIQKKSQTEDALDLENDHILIKKIKKDLNTLTKQIHPQDQAKDRSSHPYLRKNASSLRRQKNSTKPNFY